FRTAQLVGNHGFTALGGLSGERLQLGAVTHALEEQYVSFDFRIVQRGGADLSNAEIHLAAYRHHAREADAAGLAARHEGAQHAAAVRRHEDLALWHVRLSEGGIGGEHQTVTRVDHAEAARTDNPGAAALSDTM